MPANFSTPLRSLTFIFALASSPFVRGDDSPAGVTVGVPLMSLAQAGAKPAVEVAQVKVTPASGVGGAVFTQRVPPESAKMLGLITGHLEKLHPGKLTTGRTEIAYVGAVAPQDIAASGLALSVALDAMLGGWTPERGFVAIGAFEREGDAAPVKNALPQILSAIKSGAPRVLVTEKQMAQVTDAMIISGIAAFSTTEIFGVNSYEDVKAIADSKLTKDMKTGLDLFAEVQGKLHAPDVKPEEVLREDDVKEALREALTATPTSLSARLLLRVTTGQFDTLSVDGTMFAIETMAPAIFAVVQSRMPNDAVKMQNSVAQAEITRLKETKSRFDKHAQPLVDAVLAYGEFVRSFTERPAKDPTETLGRNRSLLLTSQAVAAELAKFKTLLK